MIKQLLKSALGSLLLFALLVTSAYAWLSMSNAVGSGHMGITITPVNDLTTVSCHSLQYDGIYGAACYRIGEDDGERVNLTMTEFDKIFRDRNVNTPIIFVTELGHVADETGAYIGIRIPSIEKYIKPEDGSATNEYVNTDGPYAIEKFISNVISVKIGCSTKLAEELQPTNSARVNSNVTVFNSAHSAFAGDVNPVNNPTGVVVKSETVSFAHAAINGAEITFTKDDMIEIKLPQSIYSSHLFEGVDDVDKEGNELTSNHLMFYVQIDYDDALMDRFIDSIANEDVTNATFANDLDVIQIINGKE